MNRVLIANCLSEKGEKISKFLENQGINTVGVDKYEDKEKNSASSFFKLNLRHPDSVRLMLALTNPSTLIYPWEPVKDKFNYPDYSSIELFSLLSIGSNQGINSVILCIDSLPDCDCALDGAYADMNQLVLKALVNDFVREYKMKSLIITKKDNLLKVIKIFLKGGEQQNE